MRAWADDAATTSVAAATSATTVDVFMASPPGCADHNTDDRRRLRFLRVGRVRQGSPAATIVEPPLESESARARRRRGYAARGARQARMYAMIQPTVRTYIPVSRPAPGGSAHAMKIAYHLMRVNTCRRARYGPIMA